MRRSSRVARSPRGSPAGPEPNSSSSRGMIMQRREFLGTVGLPSASPRSRGARLATADIRVVVWDERQPKQKQAYDNFLGNAIADHLRTSARLPGEVGRSSTTPSRACSTETLDKADVLIWWGHVRHGEIKPETGEDDRRDGSRRASSRSSPSTRRTGRRRSSKRCTRGPIDDALRQPSARRTRQEAKIRGDRAQAVHGPEARPTR